MQKLIWLSTCQDVGDAVIAMYTELAERFWWLVGPEVQERDDEMNNGPPDDR